MAKIRHLEVFNRGVEEWNRWREKEPNTIPDLTGANFKHNNFAGIDFTKADLRDCDFRAKNLSKANFSKANICGCDFRNSNCQNADFSEVLAGQTFKQQAILVLMAGGVGLLGFGFGGVIARSLAVSRSLALSLFGASWAEFAGAILFKILNHEEIRKFTGTSFAGACLDRAKFIKAKLHKCDFSRASIVQVDWEYTQFEGDEISLKDQVSLENHFNFPNNMQLREIRLLCITRKGNNDISSFENLDLSRLNIANVNFENSILQGANLNSSILRNGNLRGADLSGISTKNTDFSGADFTGSCIEIHNISPDAIFNNVKCDYLYLVDKDKKERMPKDKNAMFKDGEFEEMLNSLSRIDDANATISPPTNVVNKIERFIMNDNRTINTGGGSYYESINTGGGSYIQGDYINMSQDLSQAAAQIQNLLEQLQKRGMTVDAAQEKVAQDLADEAQNTSTMKDKLVKWGQSLGDATVSDVVKGVVKLAIRSVGIPLP
ncbi:pentapeptide repeat protein [Tolypothrix tenuis PCC 7101]|uniref:Pentapeptide repeat protein n=1 Tax=Tolypothrix tenuis PCC 7101 TaxID=231146 RepID=A0A1Z4N2J8_9CYAN|nr:pentapeptide repeat-containing protein [Aulosira sp. FACHB-113]BAY99935.1 pentapeptide repeat protein [Tolypothrix tenuis PCC 7101]BAZ76143.1 pentapeptide repeat protein [Aulosira laxa NIES-50]